MSDTENGKKKIVPSNNVMPTAEKNSILNIATEYDKNSMFVWDTIAAEFAQSKELKEQAKLTIKEKLRAQHELVVQKIGTNLDIGKKLIFDQYLDSVSALEDNFIKKIDALDKSNDEYMEQVREEYFEFFDQARINIKKWEDHPARYQAEVERLNEQEQKRLNTVIKRLNKLEEKREKILDQTLEIFQKEQSIDSISKKFKLF